MKLAYFSNVADRTLTFKDEKCHGGKHSKERLTVLLAVNLDGSEKLTTLSDRKSNETAMFQRSEMVPYCLSC